MRRVRRSAMALESGMSEVAWQALTMIFVLGPRTHGVQIRVC